jgi:hypothetical protein
MLIYMFKVMYPGSQLKRSGEKIRHRRDGRVNEKKWDAWGRENGDYEERK